MRQILDINVEELVVKLILLLQVMLYPYLYHNLSYSNLKYRKIKYILYLIINSEYRLVDLAIAPISTGGIANTIQPIAAQNERYIAFFADLAERTR
jgi:hypothetical protein